MPYALIICIGYIAIVGFLGVAIRDDFFALTFPSWPFLIQCAENCGYKIFIALFANGILIGVLAFFFMCVISFSIMLGKKSYNIVMDRYGKKI
jgi:hypothetical protein